MYEVAALRPIRAVGVVVPVGTREDAEVISVDELATIKALGVHYLAGSSGGFRSVTWAHVCDLADPWEWVGPGDLVMTTGGGLPSDPQGQAEWLERLAAVGISGLVLAPRPGSADVSPAMLAQADALALPMLGADFSVHFVELARAVIESSIQMQRERAEVTMRIYDAHAAAVRSGHSPQERFAAAARAARHRVWLLDAADRQLVLASDPAVPAPEEGDEGFSTIPLPTRPPMIFVAERLSRAPTGEGLLEHLTSLAALEWEHVARDRDRQRTAGAELLAALVDERLDLGAAWPELRNRRLGDKAVLVLCRSTDGTVLPHTDVQHAAPFRDIAPPLLHRSPLLFAIVPDQPLILQGLQKALGDRARLGVSNPIGPSGSLRESVHEAHLALARTDDEAALLVRYADQAHSISLVPRSVDECKTLVEAVLGPLLRYDDQHDSDLVTTLRTFLALDRSAQITADTLHVHRQTLTYRLRRVNELTGRSTASSADVAAFWIAFEAAARLGIKA